jgi:hypothetical protein
LRLFDNRYELDGDKKGNFGLANLSVEEYNRYGIPLRCMDNPIFQNRVLVHEFQRANDLLGSERKAIFALAGGDLRTPEGEVTVDTKGKANGRGAYLKKDKEVILKAQKSKVLDKMLEVSVPEEIYAMLLELI